VMLLLRFLPPWVPSSSWSVLLLRSTNRCIYFLKAPSLEVQSSNPEDLHGPKTASWTSPLALSSGPTGFTAWPQELSSKSTFRYNDPWASYCEKSTFIFTLD
jgi:hypothetical protein